MRKSLSSISVILFAAVFGIIAINHSALAIGITPPEIQIPSILKNTIQERSVIVYKDSQQNGKDTIYEVVPRGENGKYIDAEPELLIPADETSGVFTFYVTPGDAANGDYEVQIEFRQKLIQEDEVTEDGAVIEGGAGVAVLPGVVAKVKFTVGGEEIVDYDFTNIQTYDTEIGRPLLVDFSIKNLGNVDWRPETVVVNLQDQLDSENTVEYEFTGDDIPLAIPGADQPVNLEVSSHTLVEGTYDVSLTMFDEGEEVGAVEGAQFTVYPQGTLQQSGEVTSFLTDRTTYAAGEIAKLEATFNNTGDIPVKATLVTEIYKDGVLIDLHKSDELEVGTNAELPLDSLITLEEPGAYKFSSVVNYGSSKAIAGDINVVVESDNVVLDTFGLEAANLSWIVIGVLVFVILGMALMMRKKRGAVEEPVKNVPAKKTASKKSSSKKKK